VLTDDDRAAIEAARRSGVASDNDVAAFWKRHGIGRELSIATLRSLERGKR
jgi:hypothetical protein